MDLLLDLQIALHLLDVSLPMLGHAIHSFLPDPVLLMNQHAGNVAVHGLLDLFGIYVLPAHNAFLAVIFAYVALPLPVVVDASVQDVEVPLEQLIVLHLLAREDRVTEDQVSVLANIFLRIHVGVLVKEGPVRLAFNKIKLPMNPLPLLEDLPEPIVILHQGIRVVNPDIAELLVVKHAKFAK